MNINGFFDLPVNQQNLINMVNARDNLNHYKLTNDWLFGFIEAEAELRFKPRNIGIVIEQHVSDYFLMVAIQKFVGVGDLKLAKHKDGMVLRYTLYDKDKIENFFLPFFSKGLIGASDLQSITDVPLNLNRWVQEWFPSYFNKTTPRLDLTENWLVGFIDGDGTFYTKLAKAKDYKIGFQMRAAFGITQDIPISDQNKNHLFKQIKTRFFLQSCTNIFLQKKDKTQNKSQLRNETIKSLLADVIPFFDTYKLQSRKEIQYWLWKHSVFFINNRGHRVVKNKEKIENYRKLCHEFANKPSIECQAQITQLLKQQTINQEQM